MQKSVLKSYQKVKQKCKRTEKFAELIQSEFERIERMKADKKVTDFSKFYIEKQGRDAVAVHALHER